VPKNPDGALITQRKQKEKFFENFFKKRLTFFSIRIIIAMFGRGKGTASCWQETAIYSLTCLKPTNRTLKIEQ